MKKRMIGDTKLMVIDDLPPEDGAMLQALYSRSAASAEEHFEKATTQSGKLMDQYVVGFNHKSIADCGSTTVYIEDVSLLAAKAVQDSPLYNGQETSTRYIDMGKRRLVNPAGSGEGRQILERWMDFYRTHMPAVIEHVRALHPQKEGEKDKAYDGAIRARAFDIMRGFLPAGITTQLSWHTNLRQAGDRLTLGVHHPAGEVRTLNHGIRSLLAEAYSSSGIDENLPSVSGVKRGEGAAERAEWEKMIAEEYSYHDDDDDLVPSSGVDMRSTIDAYKVHLRYSQMLWKRPRGALLPHFLNRFGQISFSFLLDFGSFRDIQRHRNGVCLMPLLTMKHGFERWYLESLPSNVRAEAYDLIALQEESIAALKVNDIERQYYIPLGYRVPCHVTYGLPAAVYVMEIRSTKYIHPTLRKVVHAMVDRFEEAFPSVKLHIDRDPDDWTVRRGLQTITERSPSLTDLIAIAKEAPPGALPDLSAMSAYDMAKRGSELGKLYQAKMNGEIREKDEIEEIVSDALGLTEKERSILHERTRDLGSDASDLKIGTTLRELEETRRERTLAHCMAVAKSMIAINMKTLASEYRAFAEADVEPLFLERVSAKSAIPHHGDLADVLTCIQTRKVTPEEAVLWRVAELRVKGEEAHPLYEMRGGIVTVSLQRENGEIEDPMDRFKAIPPSEGACP